MSMRQSFKSVRSRFNNEKWLTRRLGTSGRIKGRMLWRRPSASAKATRALQLIRKFKREEEKKFIETTLNFTTLADGTAQYDILNPVAQGNTNITRIGNKITLDSLTFNGYVSCGDTETHGANIRVIISYHNTYLASTTYSNVLQNQVAHSLYTRAEDKAGHYKILYDKVFNVAVNNGVQQRYMKFTIPLNGLKVRYDGAGGTDADISNGAIQLTVISELNDINAICKGYVRIRFRDA